ncbi:MAG: ABC transporter permease [archaeon]|jgi:peptide/nickel transport system permease protein|nr:ABC transporter permease [archaeon]
MTTVSDTWARIQRNSWVQVVSMLFEKRSAQVGGAILLVFALFILIGPLFITYAPQASVGPPNSPPSIQHIFGTDYLGRDVASEVIWGAHPSIFVSLTGSVAATILGLVIGVFGGYYAKLEGLLTGLADVVITIPSFPLMILTGLIFPYSDALIAGVLSIVLWPPIARSVRSQTLSIKERPFIEAAKTSGIRDFEIVWRMVLPEVSSIALAFFVLTLAISTVFVVGLEFLGVGNLTEINWGTILYYAQQFGFFNHDWWWIVAPGAAITLFASAFALIGFSVEEAMNPRLRMS